MITVYLPLEATRSGTAILIAPGCSYTMLASNHEGRRFSASDFSRDGRLAEQVRHKKRKCTRPRAFILGIYGEST